METINYKKENTVTGNKNLEVKFMKSIPYNNQQLLKWSAFIVERSDDRVRPYNLIKKPLPELVKTEGYEKFRDRLNWLYKNYSAKNYDLVWSELQEYNSNRIQKFFQDNAIAKADYILSKQIESAKYHYGDIPAWIEKLNDNQRALLLDRARTCYGLEPEYIELETKGVYSVPVRYIKDVNEYGEVTYYNTVELSKDKNIQPEYVEVVGRVKVHSEELKRLAENAVIRDASWFAKYNDTEYDLREHREVEGDTEHNKMEPIRDLQGPESPYGIEVQLRDFQFEQEHEEEA